MKLFSLLIFSLISIRSFTQINEDTLNRFDSNHNKTGYWICYLDSNFNLSKKENAKHYGIEHYQNGKRDCQYFSNDKFRIKSRKKYFPYNNKENQNDSPLLLNGEVFYYDKYDSLEVYEKYTNGHPVVIEEYAYTEINKTFQRIKWTSEYYDSLYNNIPHTFLHYEYDSRNGLPEYKQYYKNRKTISETYILYKHKVVKSINKPRIGYIFQNKSFLEIGYSKKYTKQTIDTAGVTRFPTEQFPGFTLSLLCNWNKAYLCIGQKAVFTYFYKFINSEIGVVNYTKSKTSDFRITLSSGVSVLGRLSLMYSYSIPLTNNIFNEISRNSFSIIIH